jgi:hypothetical protein
VRRKEREQKTEKESGKRKRKKKAEKESGKRKRKKNDPPLQTKGGAPYVLSIPLRSEKTSTW